MANGTAKKGKEMPEDIVGLVNRYLNTHQILKEYQRAGGKTDEARNKLIKSAEYKTIDSSGNEKTISPLKGTSIDESVLKAEMAVAKKEFNLEFNPDDYNSYAEHFEGEIGKEYIPVYLEQMLRFGMGAEKNENAKKAKELVDKLDATQNLIAQGEYREAWKQMTGGAEEELKILSEPLYSAGAIDEVENLVYRLYAVEKKKLAKLINTEEIAKAVAEDSIEKKKYMESLASYQMASFTKEQVYKQMKKMADKQKNADAGS